MKQLLLAAIVCLSAPYGRAEAPTSAGPASALIEVHLTEPNGLLYVNGTKTESRGSTRLLQTPPLESGKSHLYHLRAAVRSGDNLLIQDQTVEVQSGRTVTVKFDGTNGLTVPLPSASSAGPEILPPPRRASATDLPVR